MAITLDEYKLTVANLALGYIGQAKLASLTEDSSAARNVALFYQPELEALLVRHPWDGATLRALLTADVDAPEFGFSTRYAVPDDCLRVLEVGDEDATLRWKREAGFILCDFAGDLPLRYITRTFDPELLDPLFTKTMALQLANALAVPLSAAPVLANKVAKDLQLEKSGARFVDAAQSGSTSADEDDRYRYRTLEIRRQAFS